MICRLVPTILPRQLLQRILQSSDISTDDAIGQRLAVFEQDKGRHGVHAKFLSYPREFIHIDLDETDIGVGFAELADNWRNSLAGTAPSSEKVDENGAGGGQRSEFGFTGKERLRC